MGLFSFGNKDAAPARRARAPGVVRMLEREGGHLDCPGRASSRARRAPSDGMLDPALPEKQRARRRLVGAITLVVAAVIVLPMVLDSHPRPVTDDIAIDIPRQKSRVPAPVSPRADQLAVGEGNEHDSGVAGVRDAANDTATTASVAASRASTGVASVPARGKAGQSASHVPEYAAAAPGATVSPGRQPADSTGPAPTDAVTAALTPSQQRALRDHPPPSPNAPLGSRFAVQLGSFGDEAAARGWLSNVKAVGVPAYLEHQKQADGHDRVLLRAGPFADRAQATAALRTVRQAGLSGAAASGGSGSVGASTRRTGR